MHFPANTAPKWCPAPFVATIHDLIPLLVPGEASTEQMLAFERGVGRAVTHAARIITPSSATRDALHQRLDVPLDRMIVIPWAPDDRIAAEARQGFCPRRRQRLRDTYGLGQRWLLSFSGGTPRKNALGVLRGFARVPLHVREDFQVVLAGCEPATVRDELAREAQRLGLADRCRVLGFVPYRDLPALLRGASGLLMPSRGEGFGLPILDAFACGVPVLTSNLDSMPEVAGNAAVYCDPEDPDSIAAGIARLLNPPTAAHLVPRGYKQLARFSWERTAEAICATYEQCLRGTASKSVAPAAAALEGCPR
jgi:glycosyltransferase involved in cell wall biosynthesis